MTTIHLDFETRSQIDLRKVGLHRYAEHPTTEVICVAWAVDEGPVEGCHILQPDTMQAVYDSSLIDFVRDGARVVAHNAAFEYAVWNGVLHQRFGWPALKVEQMECTMSRAYAMSLPGSLDGAASALGIDTRKDQGGHRLMLQMCKPRKVADDGTVTWWDDDDRMSRLLAYCMQDVEVERELDRRLMKLRGGV